MGGTENINTVEEKLDEIASVVQEQNGSGAAGLIRAIVNQMQVVVVVVAGINWSPDIPFELINPFVFVLNLISIDISSMLSGPECQMELSIFQRWQLSMLYPIIFFGIFIVWYLVVGIYHINSEKYVRLALVETIQTRYVYENL